LYYLLRFKEFIGNNKQKNRRKSLTKKYRNKKVVTIKIEGWKEQLKQKSEIINHPITIRSEEYPL
jgi:hypothetical protein